MAIYYFRRHASRWELSWSKENLVVVDWKNWRRILRGFYNRKKTWGKRHVSEDVRFCFCEFFLLCPTLFLDGSLIVLLRKLTLVPWPAVQTFVLQVLHSDKELSSQLIGSLTQIHAFRNNDEHHPRPISGVTMWGVNTEEPYLLLV